MEIETSNDPTSPNDSESNSSISKGTKRKRLRKGTKSCWACKKRKVRCTFASPSDSTCINCRQRGSTCVGQDVPEQEAEDGGGLGDRISRVESLLQKLVDAQLGRNNNYKQSDHSVPRIIEAPTPFSDSDSTLKNMSEFSPSTPSQSAPLLCGVDSLSLPKASGHDDNPIKYKQLSQTLIEMFPSQKDIDYICKIGLSSMSSFQHLHAKLRVRLQHGHSGGEILNILSKIPGSNSHPVLLANRLLTYAVFVQQLPLNLSSGLSEHPQTICKKLVDAARLVTTDDELLGTFEGLECLLLESAYQANCGNLRKAWLSSKRSLAVGQLMGIDRSATRISKEVAFEHGFQYNPQFMWLRLIYVERLLCLLLGLPQADNETNFANDIPWIDNTPIARLERAQSSIAAKIIQRNRSDPLLQDPHITQEIDLDLINAAKSVPAEFWANLNFLDSQISNSTTIEMDCCKAERLMLQMFHYTLVSHLHLPYLLQFGDSRCEYSKVTAVNASRELLTRYILFRTYNHVTTCCRIADFIAIMAAIMLLLAHLDSHRPQKGANFLAHQRLSDLGLMEQVLQSMDDLSKKNEDVLTSKSTRLLRCLLHIEAEAANGNAYKAEKVTDDHADDESNVLKLSVPYFGTIRIAREGIASSREESWNDPSQLQSLEHDNISLSGNGLNSYVPEHSLPATTQHLNVAEYRPIQPGFAAGLDDWIFQGVDTAFFDSLMRGRTLGGDNETQSGDQFGMTL